MPTPPPPCLTCRAYVPLTVAESLSRGYGEAQGLCHGGPPGVFWHWSVRGLEVKAFWPPVRADDWCLAHVPREGPGKTMKG